MHTKRTKALMHGGQSVARDVYQSNDAEIERLARMDKSSWWIRARRALIRMILRRYLAERTPVTIGDFGCGAGGMFEVLKEFGLVMGIDLSTLAVTLCRDRGYAGVAIGTVERLPLGTATLDLVAMTDVLEHIEDHAGAIRECMRVLKPGGILLITVPAHPWLYGKHDEAIGHFRRYSRQELLRLLSSCGLHIERITYFNILLFPLIMLRRLVSNLRPGPIPHSDPLDLPDPLNWLAYQFLAAERFLVNLMDLPFGVSLLSIGRKRIGADASSI